MEQSDLILLICLLILLICFQKSKNLLFCFPFFLFCSVSSSFARLIKRLGVFLQIRNLNNFDFDLKSPATCSWTVVPGFEFRKLFFTAYHSRALSKADRRQASNDFDAILRRCFAILILHDNGGCRSQRSSCPSPGSCATVKIVELHSSSCRFALPLFSG